MAKKEIGSDWTWFTDYIYAYSTWTLNVEHGRRCEVGTGIKFRGKPRGEKKSFTTHTKFTTVGIGAIHVRVTDGKGPCMVQLDQGDVGTVPIYR